MLEDTAVRLPNWTRLVFAVLAVLFFSLSWWLACMATVVAVVGSVATAALGAVLVVSAIRGQMWRWLWIAAWVPGKPGV